jgi:hypothetical protein
VHDMSWLKKCMDLIRHVSNRINYQRVALSIFDYNQIDTSKVIN